MHHPTLLKLQKEKADLVEAEKYAEAKKLKGKIEDHEKRVAGLLGNTGLGGDVEWGSTAILLFGRNCRKAE